MRKVLFVVYDNPIDPLGIMYLIGASKNEAIFDVLFVKDVNDKKVKEVNVSSYDIIAFSTITGTHQIHNDIARYFKQQSNVVTIMGGPHPTFFPKEALELDSIDYICIGEGISAFNKFLKGQKTGNIIKNYNEYSGILEPSVDLNTISLSREEVYRVDNRDKNPIRNFMGIWGCPFDCSYCYSKSYSKLYPIKERIRFKSPQKFIEEIEECVNKYETKFIYIQDDTFIINRKWLFEVTDLIKQKIDLPYHCHIRCDLMNDEIAKQLKNTGCYSVTFAIENASEEYRRKYLNRRMTNEQILYTSNLLHKYDIKFRIENMVGLPDNNLKDNLETMKINYKCRPTIGWASLFQPFPNTPLGNVCKDLNVWNGNIDTINSSFFDTTTLKISNHKEVERLQKIFSLCVGNSIWKFLAPLLIRLPLDRWYRKLYTEFKIKKYNELYSY